MKLSDEAKNYAAALFSKQTYELAKWGEEDRNRIRATATRMNPNIGLMTNHYIESARRSVMARLNSYAEAYKVEGLLIDEEDKEAILEEIKGMIDARKQSIANLSTIPEFRIPATGERIPNIDSHMADHLDRILGEAAIELNLLKHQMAMNHRRKAAEVKPNSSHQVNIYGHNLGPIQQGGQSNTQNVTINAEFEAKINELLTVVEKSSLAQLEKLRAINDIKVVRELSMVESSPEVVKEAKSRLDSVQSVISLSADLLSLGMPIIQVIRSFFTI